MGIASLIPKINTVATAHTPFRKKRNTITAKGDISSVSQNTALTSAGGMQMRAESAFQNYKEIQVRSTQRTSQDQGRGHVSVGSSAHNTNIKIVIPGNKPGHIAPSQPITPVNPVQNKMPALLNENSGGNFGNMPFTPNNDIQIRKVSGNQK